MISNDDTRRLIEAEVEGPCKVLDVHFGTEPSPLGQVLENILACDKQRGDYSEHRKVKTIEAIEDLVGA